MTDLLSRVNSAESRLDSLEEAEWQRCDSPSATVEDVTILRVKLAELEDRERRLNLRIYGFPEKRCDILLTKSDSRDSGV
ncbi:hypothetical protein NL108_013865 [Boleophthalmus pectinirostris]|nr:hypothetical protein NL108_013865 [Boleophthalmus pectinirostris]